MSKISITLIKIEKTPFNNFYVILKEHKVMNEFEHKFQY